jgi:DNA modification methylase
VIELHHGDCLTILAGMRESSVDALVSDPPAGIAFMGKEWDKDRGGRRNWVKYWTTRFRAALRVMKPGAHGLVWALPRTSHWTATALEDAGFELRDVLVHIFGQGFPKSHNGDWGGTALKPASEHWILVRKPLAGTVAANFAKHGTGGLNIDGCRIGWDASSLEKDTARRAAPRTDIRGGSMHAGGGDAGSYVGAAESPPGRWPANVLLHHHVDCELVGTKRVKGAAPQGRGVSADTPKPPSVALGSHSGQSTVQHVASDGTEEVADWRCVEGCPVRMLDEQSGELKSGTGAIKRTVKTPNALGAESRPVGTPMVQYTDRGGASRFFYCGKATRRERGDENDHPTVKSTELMRYLTRLVTPKGGVVLDITMGSGSTGLACLAEAFSFIGIDLDAKNVAIARSRLVADSPLFAGVG